MAQPLSAYLRKSHSDLQRRGVLDSIIGVDTNLFVDPHLLRRSRIPELRRSGHRIEQHFQQVLRLILASRRRDDVAWREARRRLTFPELRGVSIGYGVTSSDGNAIGPVLANRLLETGAAIAALGIRDPEIFELIGLFEEDFGADRLSDMIIWIIRDDLYAYSARVTQGLGLGTGVRVTTGGAPLNLPRHPNGRDPLVFLPTAILRDLPVALTWDDISRVVATNQELRQRLNALIGRAWRRGQRIPKRVLRQVVLADPTALRSLVHAYKQNTATAYDIEEDATGLLSWYEEGQRVAAANPLPLTLPTGPTINDLERVVGEIVSQFKRNIELNGLNEHLYEGRGLQRKPRHERYSQRLFYSVADTYCRANDLDVSREPSAGSGPVDFKVSAGYERKVLVEIKLSSNSAVLHGFEKQLPAYAASEASQRSVYVIIRVANSMAGIENVLRLKAQLDRQHRLSPTVVVVDGRLLPAATRRR